MNIKKPTVEEFEQYRKECNIHGYKTGYETLKEALDYFFGYYQHNDNFDIIYFEVGDVVYDVETDELGIIIASHHQDGFITSYNIETMHEYKDGWYNGSARLGVYNIDNNIILISRGDFKKEITTI